MCPGFNWIFASAENEFCFARKRISSLTRGLTEHKIVVFISGEKEQTIYVSHAIAMCRQRRINNTRRQIVINANIELLISNIHAASTFRFRARELSWSQAVVAELAAMHRPYPLQSASRKCSLPWLSSLAVARSFAPFAFSVARPFEIPFLATFPPSVTRVFRVKWIMAKHEIVSQHKTQRRAQKHRTIRRHYQHCCIRTYERTEFSLCTEAIFSPLFLTRRQLFWCCCYRASASAVHISWIGIHKNSAPMR